MPWGSIFSVFFLASTRRNLFSYHVGAVNGQSVFKIHRVGILHLYNDIFAGACFSMNINDGVPVFLYIAQKLHGLKCYGFDMAFGRVCLVYHGVRNRQQRLFVVEKYFFESKICSRVDKYP